MVGEGGEGKDIKPVGAEKKGEKNVVGKGKGWRGDGPTKKVEFRKGEEDNTKRGVNKNKDLLGDACPALEKG